jgi:hypothetical protein
MKSKMPEIIALILLIVSLLVPPWKAIAGVPDSGPVYFTEWALIFEGPSRTGSIDVVLLLVELFVIAGIYFLLKLILKPPKT